MKTLIKLIKRLFSRKERTFRYYPAGFEVESTCVSDDSVENSFFGCDVNAGDWASPCGIGDTSVNTGMGAIPEGG